MKTPLAYLDDEDLAKFERYTQRLSACCATCEYFQTFDDPTWPAAEVLACFKSDAQHLCAIWAGECHRFPPVYRDRQERCSFPDVDYDDWCGEHRRDGKRSS